MSQLYIDKILYQLWSKVKKDMKLTHGNELIIAGFEEVLVNTVPESS